VGKADGVVMKNLNENGSIQSVFLRSENSYLIKAKPTTYAGCRFRSRLEAQWAAFFDELSWDWEYEPFDLEKWAPDFSIRCFDANMLVEVKPIEWATNTERNNQIISQRPDLEKIKGQAVLILGTSLIRTRAVNNFKPIDLASIGVFVFADGRKEHAVFRRCYGKRVSITSGYSKIGFQGVAYEDFQDPMTLSEMQFLWNSAKSKVQWNSD